MAGRMFVRQIDAPMEYRCVYRSGSTLMLAEDYLHPVATAKSVGGGITLRPAMERQTRADMQSEPSHEAVDKEIAYRWSQEVSAMGNWTIKIHVFTLKKL